MMDMTFSNITYEDQIDSVTWKGINIVEGDGFELFMSNDVASRLNDEEGTTEYESYMRGLATTGFQNDNINKILSAAIHEERDWAVGEAIAEAYLGLNHNVIWPWNMERDKRNSRASLPGADIIGFEVIGENVRLALGEVKTSFEKKNPPQILYGKSGMIHQIDNLANDLEKISQILKWLWFRCKKTEHEYFLSEAAKQFAGSGNKDVALFGVLIRDTKSNQLDLRARGKVLSKKIQHPTTCHLIGIYLPCKIVDLPERMIRCRS